MCLYVTSYDKPEEEEQILYKGVGFYDGKYFPPIVNGSEIKIGHYYKAKRILINKIRRWFINRDMVFPGSYMQYKDEIHGGAIHVFSNLVEACRIFPYQSGYKILVCKGRSRDFIARNNRNQACYTKVYVERELTEDEFNNT